MGIKEPQLHHDVDTMIAKDVKTSSLLCPSASIHPSSHLPASILADWNSSSFWVNCGNCTGTKGICHIVFLPSGGLTGHFIEYDSNKGIGLYGNEVLTKLECMRDDDWKLIRLHLIDHASQERHTTLVEKCGGDSARFSNVSRLEDIELEALEGDDQILLLEGLGAEVTFSCSVIKSDGDAQQHIQRYHTSLGHVAGAIVNIGEMEILRLPSRLIATKPNTPGFDEL